ncbi:MAG: hypothetical protein SWJ54_12270 [Cyanobacteriota bacterium]|nr:hypothetical protein [Cyanobacteriota bacterium]
MKLKLFGLLHIKEGEITSVNLSVKSFKEQISTYLDMSSNLYRSLQTRGVDFTLITNRKDFVESMLSSAGSDMPVVEIDFSTKPPTGKQFFSAHFKLDVFRYLASLNEQYVGLCDLDMICINDFPKCLKNMVESQIPMFYDISDQVMGRREAIIRDLESIHHLKSEGRWAGGEFIAGPPEFFKNLAQETENLYDNYLSIIEEVNHVGDETVTSAALEVIRRKGIYICDAGTLGVVGRYWGGASSRFIQKPLRYFENCFLLHLPSSKAFLANLQIDGVFSSTEFKKKYRVYRLGESMKSFVRRQIVRKRKKRVVH